MKELHELVEPEFQITNYKKCETKQTAFWSSQDLVESLSRRLMSRFELLRTHAAEMAVAAR